MFRHHPWAKRRADERTIAWFYFFQGQQYQLLERPAWPDEKRNGRLGPRRRLRRERCLTEVLKRCQIVAEAQQLLRDLDLQSARDG